MPHDSANALSPSLEDAQRALREDGFIDLQDTRIGEYVQQMELRKFPFFSKWGLESCKTYVFDDEVRRIPKLLVNLLGPCRLGHWLRYKAEPNHVEALITGGREAGLGALGIHQIAKGSRITFYPGSHLVDLPTKKTEETKRGLHETTDAALREAGCEPVEKEFPDGGLIIRAGRLYVSLKEGYVITIVFATKQVLASWPEIELPPIAELIRNVIKLETEKIQVNFAIGNSITIKTHS
ncbi:hypothetical protein EDB81DRAFT_655809 [Dactylonectria macrodidyma]|uniref:Uncharacterized protein n=1 Tax=Dactylonectria macrodidyma TaxID=307937 RepID=A0A9P9EI79_9HYPO|nr:hypothetical protein EDB81DRAFT_655809 [Dactylonectria macrodidyma]